MPRQISFKELETVQEGIPIRIKGFLYLSKEGQWVLSTEPDLKSCCIGSASKRENQIVLLGDFNASTVNRAATVEGILQKNNGRFVLEKAVMEETTSMPYCFIMAGFLFLFFVVFKMRKIFRNAPLS